MLSPDTLNYIRKHMATHEADGTACALAPHMVVRLVDALDEAIAERDLARATRTGPLRLITEDTTT
jgi:hypothetical protein